MQPTLTQNSALYFAQHKVAIRRAAHFRQFRIAARTEPPNVRRLTFGDAYLTRQLHRDNGRWAGI